VNVGSMASASVDAISAGIEAVPVHATGPSGAEAEASADAPHLDEAVAGALVVEASPRPPGAMSAITQQLDSEQRPSHGRPDPIGPDDDVADYRVATLDEYLAVLGDVHARRPET
jgi:hypothetical protein